MELKGVSTCRQGRSASVGNWVHVVTHKEKRGILRDPAVDTYMALSHRPLCKRKSESEDG